MSRGSDGTSGFGKVRHSVGRIAYAAQASVFACEEGVIIHEAIGALSEGPILIDLTFRRRAFPARSSERAGRNWRGAARRRRRHAGWGIQEGHLKRLIILYR